MTPFIHMPSRRGRAAGRRQAFTLVELPVGRKGKRAAFTLVELLVGIAMIVLLVSILAPAIGASLDQARRVVCQSRLRLWGPLFDMYASANRDTYPHIDGLDRDKGPADRFGWVDVLPPINGDRPWRDYPIWQRPGTDTMFQCPVARLAPDEVYGYQPRRNGYFTYAMNSCLELDEDCYRADGDGGAAMPSFLDVTHIVRPEAVVLLFEQLLDPTRGYGGETMLRTAGKYCGSYPKAFSARHPRPGERLGGGLLFCDGHVEFAATVWKDDWPADADVPPRSDTMWFPYPLGCGP